MKLHVINRILENKVSAQTIFDSLCHRYIYMYILLYILGETEMLQDPFSLGIDRPDEN